MLYISWNYKISHLCLWAKGREWKGKIINFFHLSLVIHIFNYKSTLVINIFLGKAETYKNSRRAKEVPEQSRIFKFHKGISHVFTSLISYWIIQTNFIVNRKQETEIWQFRQETEIYRQFRFEFKWPVPPHTCLKRKK